MENYIKDYSSALYNLACLKSMPGKYIVRPEENWIDIIEILLWLSGRRGECLERTLILLPLRERIICILTYLGYSSAEVAKTICISTAGVVKAKQRIKRKIGLPTDVSLNEFIASV